MAGLRRALFLGITADMAFAAGTFLAGFFRRNPGFDGDVVILSDGLPADAQAALARIAHRLRLLPFDMTALHARLEEAAGSATRDGLARSVAHWSPMVYTKFEMLRHFDRYDAMVACDVDLLVQGDVSDLWQVPVIGWRPLPEGARRRRGRFFRAMEDLIGEPAVPLANGGVVAVGPDLRDRHGLSAGDFYAMTGKILQRITLPAVDELALFLAASHRHLPVTPLGLDLNHPVAQAGSHEARILHAIGPDKFWNAVPLRHACPLWSEDHRIWLKAGGSPAPEARNLHQVHPIEPDRALTFARNRAFWQGCWRDLGPQIPSGLWPDLRAERSFLRLHLHGQDQSVFLEIARTGSEDRMRVSAGIEKALMKDPDLPARFDAALGALEGLKRHDGRRLLQWSQEVDLAQIPALLAHLQTRILTGMRP